MATKYSLEINHNGTDYGDFCLYQTTDDQSEDIRSLAWLTKSAHPGTNLYFEWSVNYSFSWSEQGILVPGVIFRASQNFVANPMQKNSNTIAFTYKKDAFKFEKSDNETTQGRLGICCDDTILSNTASIGIGMSEKAVFATVAEPNLRYTFKPNPKYWIAFGKFEEGEVIDLNRMTQKFEITFEVNRNYRRVRLSENNSFAFTS